MLSQQELDHRFTYHAPRGTAPQRFIAIREEGRALASLINAACPEGREKALALTKIEEAVMWANAAVARNPEGQP